MSTARTKKAVAKPPAASERVTQVWHSHPKLTLATLATVVTILTAIGPFVAGWLNDFVRRPEFAEYKATVLRSLKQQDMKDAWRDVRSYRIEATMARNRINDCNLLRDKQKNLSQLERATCAQYDQDLADASRRLAEAQAAAMASTQDKKEQP